MAYRRSVLLGEEERSALLAATAPRDDAVHSWSALMEQIPFDEVNENTQRAMPAIFANLRDVVDIPERGRMRGAFKYAWSKNTRMLHDIRPVLQVLQQQDVPYRVIKGAAVQAMCDRIGARTMGDIDLLVSERDARVVEEVFLDHGFRRTGHAQCSGHSDAVHFDALNFNRGETHVDVHVAEVKTPRALFRTMLGRDALVAPAAGGVIAVPEPELLILHAAVHGSLSSGPTDVMQAALDIRLLRSRVDPSLLVTLGRETGTLDALVQLDSRLRALGVAGSGAQPSAAAMARSRADARRQQLVAVASESHSVLRRMRARRRDEDTLAEIKRRFQGHARAYVAWLRSGQFAVSERLAARRWGGFLPAPEGEWSGAEVAPFGDCAPGVMGSAAAAVALDWRFRLAMGNVDPDVVWLDVQSSALDRLDAFVFVNGTPITRIVAGDDASRRVGIRAAGPSLEVSIRPLWTACRACYAGFDDLRINSPSLLADHP